MVDPKIASNDLQIVTSDVAEKQHVKGRKMSKLAQAWHRKQLFDAVLSDPYLAHQIRTINVMHEFKEALRQVAWVQHFPHTWYEPPEDNIYIPAGVILYRTHVHLPYPPGLPYGTDEQIAAQRVSDQYEEVARRYDMHLEADYPPPSDAQITFMRNYEAERNWF